MSWARESPPSLDASAFGAGAAFGAGSSSMSSAGADADALGADAVDLLGSPVF
jgi:hypothetical protein